MFVCLAFFVFGLTWKVEWVEPYYEARGCISVEQRLLDVEFVYNYGAPGFRDKYPAFWNIHRPSITKKYRQGSGKVVRPWQ